MAAGLPWPYLAYPVITQAMNILVGLLAMGGLPGGARRTA